MEQGTSTAHAELTRGRLAAARSDWTEACEALTGAGAAVVLPADLELLATASYLIGDARASVDVLQRSYHLHAEDGAVQPAVRCAFWLFFHLINLGDHGQAAGWLARAGRFLDASGQQGPAVGYLLLPQAYREAVMLGDVEAGRNTAARAAELGRRFADADLLALALNVEGRALIETGHVREGLAALDEAMVAVLAEEVTAPAAGAVYCSVIDACEEISELRRATEWTAALTRWCDRQPGLVTFTGQCLVHRATIRQFRGEWPEAFEEAENARQRLAAGADRYATGTAMYRLGELHRCRGDDGAAAEHYRQASEWGYDPQPGLALLRLAEGRTAPAAAAITRALDEEHARPRRSKLLPAFVEIMLAAGERDAAGRGADELAELAVLYGSTVLAAEAGLARGCVLLAGGDARAALVALREAVRIWRELGAPHDEARGRTALAQACRALGDADTAALELDAARATYARLGAAAALARLQRTDPSRPPGGATALSARELEVLRLLATGRTNRAIAEELVLAVRTVDRHVSNIFAKLGVTSRAAATAYAYRHRLV